MRNQHSAAEKIKEIYEVIVTISRLGKVIDLPVIIEEFPSN